VPELPEVETIVRGLARRITGDTITSVWIGSRSQPLKSPPAEIAKTLEGARIAGIHRAGKHIVIELVAPPTRQGPQTARFSRDGVARRLSRGRSAPVSTNSPSTQFVVHLGMTGRLVVCPPATEPAKYTHLIAALASGRELHFIDPRMFGRLSVHAASFDPGGVEPLQVSEERFIALFRGRKTPIKSALLNQKLLRGVGNIYADESLFRAGIRPRRRAATITRSQLARLNKSVREVLREAIKLGGSSISDYVDAGGEEGFFQLRHRVYGREGEPCLVCKTPIRRVSLAGRSSHYCPNCQK